MVLLLCGLLLYGCKKTEDISRTTIIDYTVEELNIETEFQAFHDSKDSTRLFVKLNTKHLLYARTGGDGFRARVQLVIVPYILGDQAVYKLKGKTIQMDDVDDLKQAKELLASTMLYLPEGKNYSLSIKIIDLNKKREITKTHFCEKHYPHSAPYFQAAMHDIRIPLFTDRIRADQTYIIKTNASPTGLVHVKYYNRSFPMPPPPFAYFERRSFDYTPDSTFTLMLDPWNKAMFTAPSSGFYHFQVDPKQKEGYTLFVSNADHPEVTEVQQLIEPFRYLVSSKEFANVANDPEQKLTFENYWIEWSGNKERARSSIKAFYTRVEDANRYFSAHVDGWKSDRGIIYIVYGKPNKVYRSASVETWIYGEENNPMSISFNFTKVINPFTANDFVLNREEYYKPSWYRSLEAWRNGRIY